MRASAFLSSSATLVCVLAPIFLGAGSAFAAPPTLVVYTYDSFMAKGGVGPAILPAFEKKCGCTVKALPSGDGAQLLTRVQLDAERGKPGAALVVGIDQAIWPRLKPWLETDTAWKPSADPEIVSEARVESGFYPFDYGVLALMADQVSLAALKLAPPSRLEDLLKPEYRRNFVLEDPRTSTPGLAFVLFATQLMGAKADAFWTSLRSQWLTLAPGWDAAYGLFLKGEAPLVWSYTTSQAYHEAHGESARYRAVVFEDGNPAQIEGAAIVKGGVATEEQRTFAHQFLDYLLTPEVQEQIAARNWMFPVRQAVKLPASFAHVPAPRHVIRPEYDGAYVTAALAKWSKAVGGVSR